MPKILYLQHGGKTKLAKWVISHFPPHKVYVEPFFGGGAVLLSKPRSPIEIANDADRSIVNVYRQALERPAELAAALRVCPYHEGLDFGIEGDDLEAAVSAIAETKQKYCGSRRSSTWRVGMRAGGTPESHTWGNWWKRVAPAVERLRGVCFHCADAVDVIRKYAPVADGLIYADPPYQGHEGEYRCAVDYSAMVHALEDARGFVVVSEYAGAEDAWPEGWGVVEREMRTQRGTKREILILNPRAADWLEAKA